MRAAQEDATSLVPLTVEEFQFASQAASAAYRFRMPLDGDRVRGPGLDRSKVGPRSVGSLVRKGLVEETAGGAIRLADTPLNRAMHAAGSTFTDNDKRRSFYWRTMKVQPLALGRRYRKYMKVGDDGQGAIHPALLGAICTVPGHPFLTKKELKAAFDLEFRRHLERMEEQCVSAMSSQL